ncbi:MAG: head-tail adaptor protein [Comamonadaceae bacterium]|nr:MAG: head-tail adaptor protein [Comamonadaceae bacterium]
MPQIGGLTDRVQLQRRMETTEDEGGHAALYVPIVTLWARVKAFGGGRGMAADARGVEVTHTVVIRHRTGVSAGDRFVYRGRALDVLGAEDISGRRKFLACRCTERQVTG